MKFKFLMLSTLLMLSFSAAYTMESDSDDQNDMLTYRVGDILELNASGEWVKNDFNTNPQCYSTRNTSISVPGWTIKRKWKSNYYLVAEDEYIIPGFLYRARILKEDAAATLHTVLSLWALTQKATFALGACGLTALAWWYKNR